MSLTIRKLTTSIGAEINGIDLSVNLDQQTLDQIYQALIDHLVIFFRDQSLSAEQQLRFSETFGTLDKPHHIYPHVDGHQQVVLLENDENRPPDTNVWHTDLTFKPNPPFASILYSQTIPETGGDTLWSSLYAAYDALPDHMKSYLSDLTAIHDMGSFRNQYLGSELNVEKLNEAMGNVGSSVHPVVKHHPITGRHYLYVNQAFTTHIYDVATDESDRILSYLYNHMNRPEFQVRFNWSEGAVAMWDNRVTQHYAVADYAPAYRRMHRVTVINDIRVKNHSTNQNE